MSLSLRNERILVFSKTIWCADISCLSYAPSTHRFVSTDLKPVCNIPLVVYREQLELAHVPAPAKNRSAVENCYCASPTSAAPGVPVTSTQCPV
ncbi:hypothetical protein AVEN_103391-1 [Araneus ventricosus]|uniref:Uncharacterized protein n=1 Tax=Araneus ventricosus TaxID=182803 RepID=A0A4Y2MAH2_ARAVE|nr:hypothetical protein AVEN_103391-1 [Araneus ventricosus]